MASRLPLASAVRGAVLRTVKVAAAGLDLVGGPKPGVTVLIYHRVGARTGSAVDLPLPLFRDQIAYLAASGRVISLDEAVRRFGGGAGSVVPSDGVVVTFDDGTSDWPEPVMPVLTEFHVPATFYVATSFVDGTQEFPGGGQPVSWSGLRDMVSTGFAVVGSHSHSHALLDRVDGSTARDELDRSSRMIEDRLGRPCRHFAYPKALLGSPAVEDEVRRRFESAVLAGGRVNVPATTDPFRIWRTPIQTADGMRWFSRKAVGGMRLEGLLRERISSTRYADSII